jgi:alanyl-tRNA synthetase
LNQNNIDTGMGVERMLALLQNTKDNYLTEVFKPLIEELEKLSSKKYGKNKEDTRAMRIIADHIKASVFILAEGITPSNTEQGYVLRRLIRRAIMYGKKLGIKKEKDITTPLTKQIIKIYDDYPKLKKNEEFIIDELNKEEDKFEKTLEKGLNKFEKIIKDKKEINCKDAFLLYQSYGFPIEMIKEIAKEKKIKINEKEFQKECKKHQELSRTASAGKFKSGLADNSEKTTKLHTATHLLLQALKIILDDKNIIQKGSNITSERLRFDFSFSRKLTKEELEKIEDLVNAQIQNSCEVTRQEMSPKQAKKKGACGIFDKKYGERVSVYTIGDFSKEICTGPHVKNTCELGHFKIIKETSSSVGVRRIKAVLE